MSKKQQHGVGDANSGLINIALYQEDYNNIGDLDRIDVITASSSSHSDLQSTGSQNALTGTDTNYRFTNNTSCGERHVEDAQESIELMGSSVRGVRQHRTNVKSPTPMAIVVGNSRSATPTNMVRRWSQNLARFSKNKRNSIREKTIYRLPSRKIVEVDGKLLSATSVDPEAEIEMLIKEIEQHDSLMQDNALGEQNRLDTLRALPQSLSTKRLLRRKLAFTIEQHSVIEQTPAWRKRLWRMGLLVLVKIWTFVCLICNGVEIWYDALKTIEGHFGSNMSSYFKFLRWLFVLNIIMFVCTFGFITLPQIVHASSGESYTSDIQAMALTQDTDASGEDFLIDSSKDIIDNSTENCKGFHLLDLLTGEGSLKSSFVFYGSYTNETFENSSSTYSLPHAYYMTMLILYLSTFVVISTSMARSYRKSFIETSGGTRSMYAQKVFCSWDFGISNRKAAELKHFGIYTEIKEVLCELGESKQPLHILWRIMIFCSRLVAHLLVTAMIAGLGIVIWILLKEFGDDDESSSWTTLYVPLVVNFSMLLLQMILSWIANMEDYRSPRRTLHIMLLRNFMLEFVVIGVLVYFLLTKKYGECWETSVGQEIYRLIIMDSVVSLLLVPLFSCIRVFVVVRIWPQCLRPEFDISQKSLGLVFNQTLLWVGLFFAPLLAAIVVVKMVLMFYMNKAMLLYLCKSPRHVWRSAQTHTLYLVFTFLSLLGVIITLGFIMTQVRVSTQCGPFRDYVYMFQIFIDGVLKLRQNHTIWLILMTLIRPAAVGGLLIIMAIMVYYLRAKSLAHCTMVKILKDMIYLEVKDKEYLLTQITNITKNREWPLEEQSASAVNGNLQSSLDGREDDGSEENVLRSRNV